MRILMAGSEMSPFARTGGLGEVIAGIAEGVASLGHEVTVVMPAYRHLRDEGVARNGHDGVAFRAWRSGDVEVMAFDEPELFDRAGIYGDEHGTAYADQWVRFGAFSSAVARLSAEFDVLHIHDAHTGPAALTAPIPTVFTIHNAAYGIIGPLDAAAALVHAPPAAVQAEGPLEWWGQANYLKAGIAGADVVTTVSPTFAKQLGHDASISSGLDRVISSLQTPIRGITNGINATAWDPATDPGLPEPFSEKDLKGRSAAREVLLERSGLDGGFLLGNVGRMSEQKGLGLLDGSLDALVESGVRFVLVGNGELDELVDGWADRHPNAVWHAEYSEELSRMVSAGADAYLMPSRFEPCGIGQMYAMRYGAVPIVHLTGGLADTVVDIDERPTEATGFGFRLFEPIELTKTIRRAQRTFERDPAMWSYLMRRGMTSDFSWKRAARRYVEAYEDAIGA